ncbi:antibiotic biosynthesis monooxygenase [Desulfobulbus rhabdoformis]|uniref:putative quinol monooxygenase n=1 Tax=Desulfobulbus rhabdoformis TaxID=34032 RepID=UPI0019626ED5|nr:putative quinol monooxygenase [Desulfobulbus rhabdoformis]MBM9616740.1 antibiotic biosynthesis monooxygenase [Desulfobulbus rhabdoformis]
MSESKLSVVAYVEAKPGMEEKVKSCLQALLEPTRQEEGCFNYDLHQSDDNPTLFVFYENWTSKAALEAHLETPHVRAFTDQADTLLARPIDITFWSMVSGQN